jgi:hypothetical protein
VHPRSDTWVVCTYSVTCAQCVYLRSSVVGRMKHPMCRLPSTLTEEMMMPSDKQYEKELKRLGMSDKDASQAAKDLKKFEDKQKDKK